MTTPTDDLAPFWVHEVTVHPLTGQGADGPLHGPGRPAACFVEEATHLVLDATGRQVTSRATVWAPTGTLLPPGSLVDLPGGRRAQVIALTVADSGPLGLPDHVRADLT